jgi:hypothetical protein
MLPNWPAFQDAQKTKNGWTEDANAWLDTTWPQEANASFAIDGKSMTPWLATVFPTVDPMLSTFLSQEPAIANQAFT